MTPGIRILLILIVVLASSCDKEFLDKKPDKAILIPKSLIELQALLDNHQVMNRTPGLGYLGTDDFHTTDAGYNSFISPVERNAYIWAQEIEEGTQLQDWNAPYQQIFYSNVVLEGLAALPASEQKTAAWDAAKGGALFFRAYAYFNLLQLFSPPYNAAKAAQTPGVPLSLSPEIRQNLVRNTQQEGYELVLADLKEAASRLPVQQAVKTRPHRAAAYALLARIALTMGDYGTAREFAEEALEIQKVLLDYNQLNAAATKPFPVVLPDGNAEVLFYAPLINYGYLNSASTFVNPSLYQSYQTNDLRRSLFFLSRGNNNFTFKGSYAGPISPVSAFGGLTTNELYLIAAESYLRAGNLKTGLQYLNDLLRKRWKSGTFVDVTAATPEEALGKLLTERRKELVGRELRWLDLRRLNHEQKFQVTINRQVNNQTFTLEPGSLRYTFNIPAAEVAAYGWKQNSR